MASRESEIFSTTSRYMMHVQGHLSPATQSACCISCIMHGGMALAHALACCIAPWVR